jgi:outer membrane receptor for ferrienterochelin and colicin
MQQIFRKLSVFILLSIIISIQLSAQTGTVRGRVYNKTNNEPIPFVNIIIDGKPQQGTSSDIDGNYILNNVDPGYIKLVASSVGFEKTTTSDFLVTKSHPVFIDIPMTELVQTLNDVVVKPAAFVRKEETPLSLQTLSIQEIERSPGANRDISKVIQSLPGVASPVAFRNDIIVRGGGPSENRFYLDGVEIPYINHFATQGSSGGPVGIINIDLIREVQLYTGAFPAKRGNALSSVMEMKQVEGNKEKFGGRITIGASDFGLTLEGPVTKKSSLIFSVRRSYLQFLFSLLKLPFLPTYNDYQVKYQYNLNAKNQLTLISIGSLDKSTLNTGLKDQNETQRYILSYLPAYNQWSYAIGLTYRHFRDNGNDLFVLSRNMLNNEQLKYENNVEVPDSLNLDYTSQEIENKFRYEGESNLGQWKIGYGGNLDYIEYKNKTYQKFYYSGAVQTLNYSSYLDFFRWGLFGQVGRGFFNDKLQLSLGVRMDANSYSNEMNNMLKQISPRFSASYGFTEKWFLNFNIGRFYQLPAYTTLGFRDNQGTLVNDSLGVTYIPANHYVLGLEFLPNKDSKASLEGFYKAYSKYPLSIADSVSLASKGSNFDVTGNEPVLPVSLGRAYGFEFLYRNNDLFNFNIILAYTFVRSEFTNIENVFIPSSWDNKNLLNITIGRKFRHNWNLGVKYRYVGAAPYTPYDLNRSSLVSAWNVRGQGYLDYSQYNSLRLKATNQLDIRVDKGFYFKKWSLMFYVDVQNILNLQTKQPDILVNTQPDGSVITYTDNEGNLRYELRYIPNVSGTILPTVGIMVDF